MLRYEVLFDWFIWLPNLFKYREHWCTCFAEVLTIVYYSDALTHSDSHFVPWKLLVADNSLANYCFNCQVCFPLWITSLKIWFLQITCCEELAMLNIPWDVLKEWLLWCLSCTKMYEYPLSNVWGMLKNLLIRSRFG